MPYIPNPSNINGPQIEVDQATYDAWVKSFGAVDKPVSPQVDPEASLAENEEIVPVSEINTEATPVDAINPSFQTFDDGSTLQTFDDGSTLATGSDNTVSATPETSDSSPLASTIQQGINNARQQPIRATTLGAEASNGDWRVRLSLAPQSDYLYNAKQPGILQPLQVTNGVIFPYTPKIDVSYKSNYAPYDLTHANFKGYFYQNSQVPTVGITAHFTAQDTQQANYLLAVIHFLRSAGKMFYGQDAQKGSPPPLLFLSGFGQYQFNKHPCVLSDFNYTLPDDVDYIRAQVANNVNLPAIVQNVLQQSVATNNIFSSIQRLANAFTTKGAIPNTPFGAFGVPNLASGSATYVPTKMDITITLLPMVSRQKMSNQFSLRSYATGDGLRGGFW